MREDRIGEAVVFLVRLRIRIESGLEHGESDIRSAHAHAEFAVVQEADAEIVLRHIQPFVMADFKFGIIPGRIVAGGTLHIAELNVKCRLIRMHIHREMIL